MSEQKLTGYPSIDKPWLKFYTEAEINAPIPKCTVYENIFNNNHQHPNDIALLYFGKKISYKKLFAETDKAAKAFVTTGVKAGDNVVLCMPATPEAIYAILALNRLGANAVMLNPLFTEAQMVDRIQETNASILIVMNELYRVVNKVIPQTAIQTVIACPAVNSLGSVVKLIKKVRKIKDTVTWNDFIIRGKTTALHAPFPYQPEYPAIMVYSSGSTGASKGIQLTNDGVNATIAHYQNTDFPYERGDTFLQMIPAWFSTGIVLSVLMPLCVGITVIPEPIFSKESFVKDLVKYHPNMTLTATSLWTYAITAEEMRNIDLSGMKYPITGGEILLPQIEHEINQFLREHRCNSPFIKGYGMCELGSTVTSNSHTHTKEGSCGYPISGVTIAAFDPQTNQEMPYNQRGELRVLSPAHMKEYYCNPTATEEFFWTDAYGQRWGCTGDIGFVNEDGDVFVLGRGTDSYIAENGTLVYLFDAEYAILKDPAIAACKVVDVEVDGVAPPVAHVICKQSCKDAQVDIVRRIDNLCRKNLAEYAVPRGYKFRTSFPVHTNGKRDVQALRAERDGFVDAENKSIDFC